MIVAIVLMVLAALCFLLKVVDLAVGDVDLIALGLLFAAAAFVVAWLPNRRVP